MGAHLTSADGDNNTGPLYGSGESNTESYSGIIERLAAAQSQQEIAAIASQGVRALLKADGATFAVRDGDRCVYAEDDAISPLWKSQSIPMSATIAGWCMMNNQPASVPDIFEDYRVLPDAYRPSFVRSMAIVPVGQDKPLAALGAYWSEKHQPQSDEIECLQTLAEAVALAMPKLGARSALRKDRRPNASDGRYSPRSVITRIRRHKVPPDSPEAYAIAVLCVTAATLVRFAVEVSGAPHLLRFATYFPAVTMATLVGGRWPGTLALALSSLAGYWFFMPSMYQFGSLAGADVINLSLFALSCGFIILTIDWYKHAVERLQLEDASHLTIMREQGHRVRNALVVVDAIVNQSLRDDPDRARTISRRLRAGLAGVDFQEDKTSKPVTLRELLVDELTPYGVGRFVLEGAEDTQISGGVRKLFDLAIHELTTNALKYGALSCPEGRVTVAWHTFAGLLTMTWRETGGPPVQPPRKRGYGSIMLRRLVEAAGGTATTEFLPTGVIVEITLAEES